MNKVIMDLECLTSFCGHTWSTDEPLQKFKKGDKFTIRQTIWKEGKKFVESPEYVIMHCPVCGGKLIDFRVTNRDKRKKVIDHQTNKT